MIKIHITLLLALFMSPILGSAQKTARRASVRIELVKPVAGKTLRQGANTIYSFMVYNTGETPILESDTIVYRPFHDYADEGVDWEEKLNPPAQISPGDSLEVEDALLIQVTESSLDRSEIHFGVYAFVIGPATEFYTELQWEPFSEQEDNRSAKPYPFDGYLNILKVVSNELYLYPNPARNYIQISLNNPVSYCQIWSLEGILFLELGEVKNSSISISEIPKGVYLIRLRDEEGVLYIGKFAKL